MGLLLTTIFKPFDALLLSALIVLVAATMKAFAPFLPGNRRPEQPGDSYSPR